MSLSPLLLCTLLSSTAPHVLVVVPDADAAIDAGVRAGLQARGDEAPIDVLDADATTTLLRDARDAGVMCDAQDAPCWLRVATLGGLDAVVLAHGQQVVFATGTMQHGSLVASGEEQAWSAATRRALGLQGAVRLPVLPDGAVVVVDGVPFDKAIAARATSGLVVAVIPGRHEIVVTAPAHAPSHHVADVAPGAIVDVALTLVPAPAPMVDASIEQNSAVAATAWWWSGVGTLGVSAVGAGVLLAVGQMPYLRCYEADAPAGCAADGTLTSTANATAVAAMVVGSVGLVAGSGAMIAGVVLPR